MRRSEDKSLYKHVYFGDLVLNMMRAWQGAVGVVKSEAMVSPAYITAVPSAELYPLFMDYYLRRDEAIGQMNNLSYGVTDFRKRLYWDSFVKVLCHIPTVAEQEKITAFFTHLDETIALHQQKLALLKKLKQTFLKVMFPHSGGNIPTLRFDGFSEPWEQRELKKIADKVSVGIATSSSQYFSKREHGIPFIKNQNIKENWIDDRNLEYISQEFDKANSTKRIKEGDILTVRTGYPGLSAVVPKELDGAQTFTTLITRLKKGLAIPGFVSIFINSDAGMKQILGMEAGGAQKNVNAGILQNLSIPLPSLFEQKEISNFIMELDKTITLHQCKLEKLIELKNGLLGQLFL